MSNFVPEKVFLHDLKVVILAWKTKNVVGSQKSLKDARNYLTHANFIQNFLKIFFIVIKKFYLGLN